MRGAGGLVARTAAILVLVCLGILRASVSFARSTPPEYLIKAAYLYHFAMFVDWPADAFPSRNSPIVIGIVGTDPFGPAIDDTVRDKRIDGRPLVVKRLDWAQDLRQCHILFVADGSRIADVVRRVGDLSVLTVGETAGSRAGMAPLSTSGSRTIASVSTSTSTPRSAAV